MANAKAKQEDVSDSKEVVSIQDRIKNRLANINNSTAAPASKRISTKGSMFTLPDGNASAGPLNCVILDYINTNQYYTEAYDPNNIVRPACFAIGRDIAEMHPAADVTDKQADACEGCAQNEFGSAGRGKACKNRVTLALLPEGFDENAEVFTLSVSPTGIKVWAAYVRMLGEQGVDPVQVVTSVAFKEGVTYPTLTFKNIAGNESLDKVGPFLPEADSLLNSAGAE
jgi:hypothetical protein